jgi:hypothetical protein
VEARAAIEGVVSGPPVQVLEMRYGQPPAQVAETAAAVTTTRSQYLAVTRWVPAGLAVGGLVALVGGLALLARRRPADHGSAGAGSTGAVAELAVSGDGTGAVAETDRAAHTAP